MTKDESIDERALLNTLSKRGIQLLIALLFAVFGGTISRILVTRSFEAKIGVQVGAAFSTFLLIALISVWQTLIAHRSTYFILLASLRHRVESERDITINLVEIEVGDEINLEEPDVTDLDLLRLKYGIYNLVYMKKEVDNLFLYIAAFGAAIFGGIVGVLSPLNLFGAYFGAIFTFVVAIKRLRHGSLLEGTVIESRLPFRTEYVELISSGVILSGTAQILAVKGVLWYLVSNLSVGILIGVLYAVIIGRFRVSPSFIHTYLQLRESDMDNADRVFQLSSRSGSYWWYLIDVGAESHDPPRNALYPVLQYYKRYIDWTDGLRHQWVDSLERASTIGIDMGSHRMQKEFIIRGAILVFIKLALVSLFGPYSIQSFFAYATFSVDSILLQPPRRLNLYLDSNATFKALLAPLFLYQLSLIYIRGATKWVAILVSEVFVLLLIVYLLYLPVIGILWCVLLWFLIPLCPVTRLIWTCSNHIKQLP